MKIDSSEEWFFALLCEIPLVQTDCRTVKLLQNHILEDTTFVSL